MLLRFMMLPLPRGGRTKGLAVALRPRAAPVLVGSGLIAKRRLAARAVKEHSNFHSNTVRELGPAVRGPAPPEQLGLH